MTMTRPGTPTPTPMRAALEAQALEAVLNGTQWLMASTPGELHEPDATDLDLAASRWKDEGRVFAIERAGQTLYPRYLFDESGMPIPEVEEILDVFEGYAPLRIASWFESTNSLLHGRRPRECLATVPSAVVEAARDHVASVMHG